MNKKKIIYIVTIIAIMIITVIVFFALLQKQTSNLTSESKPIPSKMQNDKTKASINYIEGREKGTVVNIGKIEYAIKNSADEKKSFIINNRVIVFENDGKTKSNLAEIKIGTEIIIFYNENNRVVNSIIILK